MRGKKGKHSQICGQSTPGAIQCECGYCSKGDSTAGVWFVPLKSSQRYLNREHYLRHQYNGKMPFKKKCICGCGKWFVTTDEFKVYIEGHQKIFQCSLCGTEVEKAEVKIKKMNKSKFFFCPDCWYRMTLQKNRTKYQNQMKG